MFYRLLSAVRRQRTGRGWQNWSSGRSGASAAEAHSVALPAQAQVVICGGGIMGTSVAYHLSKMGWKDIVLLEQGRLAAGSTRFCAGILSTARHLTIEQKMADYSNKLYHQLEQETGIQTGSQRRVKTHSDASTRVREAEDKPSHKARQCLCCKLPYKTSDHGRAGNQDLHVARVQKEESRAPPSREHKR
uniref:pyruvate dehydrogenase phosphatase regulatory subunit, mitochondrial-like isoform X3 n=1 Tax=Halichoerus grypus TaxID=9711 RepID=UPI001658FC79|nr:pyruvate dehydrogenase phosphatase regulatory subunit, mitochondrial-like isoform X3 [Halichoerus grypus]